MGLTNFQHCLRKKYGALTGELIELQSQVDPRAYLRTAEALAVAPGELCLVAAHHSDLAAARACGSMTAYIHRPMEYGGKLAPDTNSAQNWDWSASDLADLAAQLGR